MKNDYVLFVYEKDAGKQHIESDDGIYYIVNCDPMTGFNFTNDFNKAKRFPGSGEAFSWGYNNTNPAYAKYLRYTKIPKKLDDGDDEYVIVDLCSPNGENYVVGIVLDERRNPNIGTLDEAWEYLNPEMAYEWLRENGLYGKQYIVVTKKSVLDGKSDIKKRMGHSELGIVQQNMMTAICNAGDLLEKLCYDLENHHITERKWIEEGTSYLQKGLMMLKRGVGRPKTF